MDPHRIVSLRFFGATSPLSRPIADATHEIPAIRFIVARLTLADGTTGEGYLLAFHFQPRALAGALADIGLLALERRPGVSAVMILAGSRNRCPTRTLSCTIPNARGVESFDWVDGLIDHPVRIEDGYAYPSDAPGWGFQFQDEFLTEISPP